MILKKTLFWMIISLLAINTTVSGQKLPQDPDLIEGKLPNGFSYYIRKNTTQKKRVTLFLVNKVGSILENDNQQGLAHFMEHMSFNGTTHFPGATLVDFLEKAGVRFGADLNAYTSFDETVYQLPLAIDKPEMLDKGLQVIRDWTSEATLDQKEIDKERGVVLEEKRLRSGAQQRIQQQTFPVIVNQSRYASREPIGTEEILKNFNRETLLSYYKDWYRPNLQAIIVVGDVDPGEVLNKVKKMFSDLKNPDQERPRPDYAIELTGKNQFLSVTDKETSATVMQVLIKYPHKALVTHADYMEYVKKNLFNQLLALRFQSLSQKNAGSYLYAGAGIGPLVANVDAFSASISVRAGELERGFAAFWKEITKIKNQGFTIQELEMAKSQYLNSIQAQAAESDKKKSGEYVQEYVNLFLRNEASPGITKEAELTDAYLSAISLAHINQLAKLRLADTNRDVIITAPESQKNILPDENQVNSWFGKYGNAESGAVNGEDAKRAIALAKIPLISTPPIKGRVVSTVKLKELGIMELKMSNGVRIILKPTVFKNDEIIFGAFSPGGTSVYGDSDFYNAEMASAIIPSGGVGDLDADQLREKLNGKQVLVNPYIGERVEGISGYSNSKDLETALQLTYLYFTRPRKDTAAFNAVMSRQRAFLSSEVNSPEKAFSDTLSAVLSDYNFRRKPITLAGLDQISLDKSFDLYKDRFKDASDFTFVIVGNFDTEKIQPLLEQYLGSLPVTHRNEQAKDLKIEIPTGIIKKTIYNGQANKAMVQLVISGDYDFNPVNNLKLKALRYILSLKMIARLREKESGIYSPAINVSNSKTPRSRYTFSIQFGCSPENADKLIAAAWDEIEKLKTEGPSKEDLLKFVAEEKVTTKNEMETNGFWLGYLSQQYREQLDPKQILDFNSRLDALTTSGLKDAMNTYLKRDNNIRVVLLPAGKS